MEITIAIVTYRPPHRDTDTLRPTLVPFYSRWEAEDMKPLLLAMERVESVELVDMEPVSLKCSGCEWCDRNGTSRVGAKRDEHRR